MYYAVLFLIVSTIDVTHQYEAVDAPSQVARIRNSHWGQPIVVRFRREVPREDDQVDDGAPYDTSPSQLSGTGVPAEIKETVLNNNTYNTNETAVGDPQFTGSSSVSSVAMATAVTRTSMRVTSPQQLVSSRSSSNLPSSSDTFQRGTVSTTNNVTVAVDNDSATASVDSTMKTTSISPISPSASSSPSILVSNYSSLLNYTIDASVKNAATAASSFTATQPSTTGSTGRVGGAGGRGALTSGGTFTSISRRTSTTVAISTAAQSQTSTAQTIIKQDQQNRRYYTLTDLKSVGANTLWINEATILNGARHEVLQRKYLQAMTVELSFPFLFYGHEVYEVTIATGGFLYMSDFLHSQLTFSQYIAPLMANFDMSISNLSHIHYLDNGTAFTVWWENVYLADQSTDKPFSFQVTLYNTSEITFVYKSIPIPVSSISRRNGAVKVGLSDAYYFDQTTRNGYTQRTISVYSRIDVNMTSVSDNTAILINPLPTCIIQKSCTSCLNATNWTPFVCNWCKQLNRCSDGLDRLRQTWLKYGCAAEAHSAFHPYGVDKSSTSFGWGDGVGMFASVGWQVTLCEPIDMRFPVARVTSLNGCRMTSDDTKKDVSQYESSNTAGAVGVLLVMIAVVLLVALVTWTIYAIKNPTSSSGQWLLEHRPQVMLNRLRQSGWCFQRVETVSSYVTFHSGLESTYA